VVHTIGLFLYALILAMVLVGLIALVLLPQGEMTRGALAFPRLRPSCSPRARTRDDAATPLARSRKLPTLLNVSLG
jgi:hypothetical protein